MILSLLTLPFRVILFVLWFSKEIITSSTAVVVDALRPGNQATPRVVRMPLGDVPDWQTVLISMLITLTPGTLTLGITAEAPSDRAEAAAHIAAGGEGTVILVHTMYDADTESALAGLDDMFRRMRRALSVQGGAS